MKDEELKIERQKFQMHSKGYKDIADAIKEAKEPEVNEIGENVTMVISGRRGPQGKPGEKPTEKELISLIEPRLPTEDKLKSIIIPLIPKPIKGEDGKSIRGPQGKPGKTPIKGIDYNDGKDGYTPKKGKDYFDGQPGRPGKDITEVDADKLVEKLQGVRKQWLSIDAIDGDFNRRIKQMVHTGGATGVTEAPIDGKTYVRKDANWLEQTDIANGDVVGPVSATDGNIPLFDTTTGKKIKDSGKKISDFAPALGSDDNYVTDAEKADLHAPHSDDQDLSGYELTSYKVTAFQTTPDDTHYTSEKLVKDSLNLKVPYTGATSNVDLGDNAIIAKQSNIPLTLGVITIATLTKNGDGTLTLANDGVINFPTTASGDGIIKRIVVTTGATLTLTDNAVNYVYADYNGGSPVYLVTLDNTIFPLDFRLIPIARVTREGTTLHVVRYDEYGILPAYKSMYKDVVLNGSQRLTGLALSTTATRKSTVSAGTSAFGVQYYVMDANIAGTTGSVYEYYLVSGVWNKALVTEYDSSYYSNGTNRATLDNNKYVAKYFWRDVGFDNEVYYVHGNQYNTVSEAVTEALPAFPTVMSSHSIYVGKIVIQKSAINGTAYPRDWNASLSSSQISDHSLLASLTWTSSGHNGTANKLPAFGTNGEAIEIDVPSGGGTSLWTAITGTRASNTTITVATDLTAIFKKGMIVRWQESGVDKVAVISIPSTYSSPNTTITIIGDTCASIDASSFKYSTILGTEQFIKNFAVAGNIGATGTDIANAYYATEPMRVLGADLQVGTAGTTNSTTIDINKAGTTMFTTKPTLATTVASSPTPFTADTTSALALGDRVSIDIDAIQTTNAIDLYVQLYLLPTRYLSLS